MTFITKRPNGVVKLVNISCKIYSLYLRIYLPALPRARQYNRGNFAIPPSKMIKVSLEGVVVGYVTKSGGKMAFFLGKFEFLNSGDNSVLIVAMTNNQTAFLHYFWRRT